LIYRDECYKIVGILYKVFKDLGSELLEKHYQRAIAAALKTARIKFIEQHPVKIFYEGKLIGIFYIDFLIQIGEAKIILEIKKNENFGVRNIKQVYGYLKPLDLKLGILANFTKTGVKYKRIVNLQK